jgi:hypothetical protein
MQQQAANGLGLAALTALQNNAAGYGVNIPMLQSLGLLVPPSNAGTGLAGITACNVRSRCPANWEASQAPHHQHFPPRNWVSRPNPGRKPLIGKNWQKPFPNSATSACSPSQTPAWRPCPRQGDSGDPCTGEVRPTPVGSVTLQSGVPRMLEIVTGTPRAGLHPAWIPHSCHRRLHNGLVTGSQTQQVIMPKTLPLRPHHPHTIHFQQQCLFF